MMPVGEKPRKLRSFRTFFTNAYPVSDSSRGLRLLTSTPSARRRDTPTMWCTAVTSRMTLRGAPNKTSLSMSSMII